jgi:hypothetical protein
MGQFRILVLNDQHGDIFPLGCIKRFHFHIVPEPDKYQHQYKSQYQGYQGDRCSSWLLPHNSIGYFMS